MPKPNIASWNPEPPKFWKLLKLLSTVLLQPFLFELYVGSLQPWAKRCCFRSWTPRARRVLG